MCLAGVEAEGVAMTEFDKLPTTTAQAHGRRRWPWALAVALLVVAAAVLFWFQPQKLLIDDKVNEAIPTATGLPDGSTSGTESPPSSTASSDDPTGPRELARGDFVSLDHGTSGVARVLELGAGERIVRLEGLDTDNGPDLFVYLTPNPANGDEGGFDDDFVNLGRLKGNRGDQNYELAPEVDLNRYTTVVIWCDRFNAAFGAADLT